MNAKRLMRLLLGFLLHYGHSEAAAENGEGFSRDWSILSTERQDGEFIRLELDNGERYKIKITKEKRDG